MQVEIFGTIMNSWQIFVSIGILFVILEIFASGFVMLPIGLALISTAVFTVWVSTTEWQIVVFAVNLLVIFFYFQKFVKPKFIKKKLTSNVDSLLGKVVKVTSPIAPGKSGYVKVYGDRWQAVTKGDMELALGADVTITAVDGNKVVVKST